MTHKHIHTLIALIMLTTSVFAQSPEKMSYQAVIRDGSNDLIANTTVGMQISILKTTANGTAVYTETHTPTTNDNGLISIEIGTGTTTDNFSTINWGNDTYFVKTETDPTGGTSYAITGTSQLLSVPYALHAKTADNITRGITEVDGSITNEIELPTTATTGDMNYWNGTNWVTVTGGTEGSNLQFISGVPTWVEQQSAAVGDIRESGVVFWVDPADNTHGLVCAFSDSSNNTLTWGCFGTDLPNVPNVTNLTTPTGLGAEIGDGINNTNNILNIADCPTSSSALAVRSLGPQWFLPSINELQEIYANKSTLEAVPGFTAFSGTYWSSTEINSSSAFFFRFLTGTANFTNKSGETFVRAVRAF